MATAIRILSERLTDLLLPADTDLVMTLVVKQQQLLEAYAHSTSPDDIDYELIREVSAENQRLIDRVKQAHKDAARQLDALALSRSAVLAYGEYQSGQVRA